MSLALDIGALQTAPGAAIGALRPAGSTAQDIIPSGLASAFAAGTPDLVYAQDIGPSGLASTFAAGTPIVQNNQITPPGLASGFIAGTPALHLDTITPPGKVSDFAAGSPTLDAEITLAPSGLASAFAAGAPEVLHVQSILPSGKSSDFAAGSPTVMGGPQRIQPSGLPSAFRAGNPTVNGGTTGIKLFVGGIDCTAYLSREGLNNPGPGAQTSMQPLQLTSQTIGRWTAVFDWWDPAQTAYPEVDQTVLIQENGVTLFRGGIVQISIDRFDSNNATVVFHVTCQDGSAICDRRVVNATYPAGSDVSTVIQDIWQTVLKNPDEGLTINNVASIGTDTLDSDLVLAFTTVTQAFDQIANLQGWVWWVDTNNDINFLPYTDVGTCPFSLTETSVNFRAQFANGTLLDYRNKQYVVSNLTAVPGIASQVPGSPGYGGPLQTESYTVPSSAQTNRGLIEGAYLTTFPILQLVSLKVNGVTQPVHLNSDPYNLQQSWWYFSGFQSIVPPNVNNDNPDFPYPPVTSAYPADGDVVELKYIPVASSQSAVVQAGNPLTPATPGVAGTWGSGVFENVEQVQNLNKQADLNTIASALLSRSNFVPVQLQFETDEPGAQVGQKIAVNLPPSFVTSGMDFTITGIQKTLLTGELEFGSQFRSVIQATTGQDLGNTHKWMERLIARTANALPVQQFDERKFVLAPGQSVSTSSAQTNPVPSNTAGNLVLAWAMAGTPPTDQNLVIDILQNGVSIFAAGGQLKIVAADALQVNTTAFALPSPTVSIGDVFTVSVSYEVTGGNPLPAASVTVCVRWSTPGLPANQSAPGVYS